MYLATAMASHLCGGLYMATAFIALQEPGPKPIPHFPLVGLRTTWRMGNATHTERLSFTIVPHRISYRSHGNLDYLLLMPRQLNLISRSAVAAANMPHPPTSP